MIKATLAFGFALVMANLAFAQTEDKIPTQFSLKEAQDYAILNSYLAVNAERDIEKAQRRVKETTAIGLPQINASAQFQNFLDIPTQIIPDFVSPAVVGVLIQNGLLPPSAGGGPTEYIEAQFGTDYNISAGVTVSQLIFDGSYIVGLQAAKLYVELSKNAKSKTDVEIKNAITQAYGMVLTAEENQKIIQLNIENLEKTLAETKALYENGFAEQQDVDQLRLLVGNLKNTLSSTKKQVEVSYNMLKFQMGIPIANEVKLTENIDQLAGQATDPQILQTDFDPNNHIDFKIALANVSSQELLLKNTKATTLPRLSAFFNYQENFLSNELKLSQNWFPTTVWGVKLDVPIFASLGRYQQIQQGKIDLENANTQKNQISESLNLEVQNAKANYTNAINKMNLEKENLALAQKISKNVQTKYKEGLASSLELTQTQNQELTSQANYINTIFSLIAAKSALDKALGKL